MNHQVSMYLPPLGKGHQHLRKPRLYPVEIPVRESIEIHAHDVIHQEHVGVVAHFGILELLEDRLRIVFRVPLQIKQPEPLIHPLGNPLVRHQIRHGQALAGASSVS